MSTEPNVQGLGVWVYRSQDALVGGGLVTSEAMLTSEGIITSDNVCSLAFLEKGSALV